MENDSGIADLHPLVTAAAPQPSAAIAVDRDVDEPGLGLKRYVKGACPLLQLVEVLVAQGEAGADEQPAGGRLAPKGPCITTRATERRCAARPSVDEERVPLLLREHDTVHTCGVGFQARALSYCARSGGADRSVDPATPVELGNDERRRVSMLRRRW